MTIDNLKTNRIRVYISGPITKGSRNINYFQALQAQEELIKLGYAPLNPMQSICLPFAWQEDINHEMWLESDLPWIRVSDVVLRLKGESEGAHIECTYAESLGIPVVYSIDELRTEFPISFKDKASISTDKKAYL